MTSRWRRVPFFVAVAATLALAAVFVGVLVLTNVVMGIEHHGLGNEQHRVHDVSFDALNGVAVIGLLAQLRGPKRNVASQLMALIPSVALLLATAVTNVWVLQLPWLLIAVGVVVATIFHPIGDPLLAFPGTRPDRVLLALVGVATIPLLALAWTMIGLQRAGPSQHALEGHYGFVAALCFTTLGVALLASARPTGWRPTAWVAGALPVVLGAVSLQSPQADSALSTGWAVVAISWGVAFVIRAELGAAQHLAKGPRAPEHMGPLHQEGVRYR